MVKTNTIEVIIQVNVETQYCLRWFLVLLAVYMASRPISWIRIFIRVNKIWEPPTFRYFTWVIKWKKSPKQYWLFLHSSKDTANPFWHQVMASWYRCCCAHALAPKRNWNICFKEDHSFPLRILKHLNLYFYFNLTNLNFSDVLQCTQSKYIYQTRDRVWNADWWRNWELYMGARRYGISLRAYEWEQGKRGISGWTLKEKFHFYKHPCIILFFIDPAGFLAPEGQKSEEAP